MRRAQSCPRAQRPTRRSTPPNDRRTRSHRQRNRCCVRPQRSTLPAGGMDTGDGEPGFKGFKGFKRFKGFDLLTLLNLEKAMYNPTV
jgi:hypothetical protein